MKQYKVDMDLTKFDTYDDFMDAITRHGYEGDEQITEKEFLVAKEIQPLMESRESITEKFPNSRERSLVLTKIDEAILWLQQL